MLNISSNQLNKTVDISQYKSSKKVFGKVHYKIFRKLIGIFFILCFLGLFLPWTQNVTGSGYVTTLNPDERPQTIHSIIPGRVDKWHVREGDFVQKGDTIMKITEIKDAYFDPNLLERTDQQLEAKSLSINSYSLKIQSLDNQIAALQQERTLKLKQARNKLLQAHLKVESDSIELEAAHTNILIAERQFERINTLQKEGLKSMTDVEEKRLKLQEAKAKLISQENKLLASRNEVINTEVEISRTNASYTDKISKAESDKFSALSTRADAEANLSKMQNQRTNYAIRRDLNYVTAPQNGYINKTLQQGIGETFKEGDPLVSIMPAHAQLAVDSYIDPLNLPLIHVGEKIRIVFDGWPSIVFSGWPNASYGTFSGEIIAVEKFISQNGKYRILIAQDPDEEPWPEALSAGSGARTIALLEDVPIWYEIWRQLNGFPPNYYTPQTAQAAEKKK
ncbi:HlyD family secretion protein [Robertkochia solimangrovi]|uniref:HlyD family secretion protein n=1 Tax=Robertkochia solimangrovi TaxID=2213046 RepID=UPI00117C2186|nr:biotin/lipoyl-binding protein [Robertkochia solimangrovi]TRZ41407.1 biotin attachment protein [Robertkochia solimangrovi]